ncbi:MAG TPA: hypothetical protein VMY76_13120, partial [Gemmatimonadales bacterium]|nr:hypothetical protein [Gemmatimonadales bacterium]
MRRPRRLTGYSVLLGAIATLVLVYGCQEAPKATEPELAVIVRKTLTVTGTGTGSGVVTSNPAGINCTITAGVPAATGCKAQYNKGVNVTLTAVPKSGHSFAGWAAYCTGTSTCLAPMTADRKAQAKFLKGPFTIRITNGTAGAGSGTVRSQAGLSPVINCVITKGVPAATGCSAKYPAYAAVVLTATPATGFDFVGWGGLCGGQGSCQLTAVQNVTMPAAFASAASPAAATEGRWAPTFQTPIVALHMHLLPSGKALSWGHKAGAYLWDFANPGAGFTAAGETYEMFCSGHTLLADGRLFVAGGHIDADHGLPFASIFDPASETWSTTTSMAQGRWYPTTTVLPGGALLTVAGADENGVMVPVPEIWRDGAWRTLTTASLTLPYYPAMFVAPNGKVFLAGPDQSTRYLAVQNNGEWTTVADRVVADRNTGSAVMYAPGKILFAGGGDPPTRSAEVIDLNDPSPAWRAVADMAYPRRHMLATVLADGKVLVTHGTSGRGFNDLTSPVHYAELWDPATELWTTMARESAPRMYHATAVLLPDARVLSSGSGEGDGITYGDSQLTAEIFSPPYLFKADGSLAARPVVDAAPTHIGYGGQVNVESPDAESVTRGTLIRLSSATHSFNQSQVIFP